MTEQNPTPVTAENDAPASTPVNAENGSETSTLASGYADQGNTTPEPAGEPTPSNDKPENPNLQYPEGFNAETYDLATKQPKMDKILEMISNANADTEKYKKQSQDMRKIISKGQAKDQAEDYVEGYVPPEQLKGLYDFSEDKNPQFKQGLDMIAKHAVDNGLNQEQFTSNVDMFNNLMTDLGIIDTRTPEQIAIEHDDWLRAEKAKINSNPVEAERIIKSTVNFFQNDNLFSKAEQNAIISQLDKSSELISVMHKLSRISGGNRGGEDIPTVEVSQTGMPSLQTIEREFADPNTSQERRVELAKMKVKIKQG